MSLEACFAGKKEKNNRCDQGKNNTNKSKDKIVIGMTVGKVANEVNLNIGSIRS